MDEKKIRTPYESAILVSKELFAGSVGGACQVQIGWVLGCMAVDDP